MRAWRFFASLMLLILLVASFEALPVVRGQSTAQELCAESRNNPVLNDSGGYYTLNTLTGSTFAYNNTFLEPTVVRDAGGFRMWYSGSVGGVFAIYTATSKDGGNWTINTSPVLNSGAYGTWDHGRVLAPSVVYNGTGYMMYFQSNNGTSIHSRSVGVAFSDDGIRWTEYTRNPVLKPGPGMYDSNWIYDASVILLNGTYMMWFAASPSSQAGLEYVNLATSSDGLHWVKYAGNPVFKGAPSEIGTVGHPDVLNLNGTLLMLYGNGYGIRYAVSHNGTSWSPTTNYLVSSTQAYWKSDYVSDPAGIFIGSTLALWYYGSSPIVNQSSPYVEGIGFATCGLLTIPVTSTTTVVSASTLIKPVTTTSTLTLTSTYASTATVTEGAVALPFFEGATVVGAALTVALAFILLRRQFP
jgi:hypothetical protein